MLDAFTDQQLINTLFQRLQNEKHARARGDAASIAQHQTAITSVLSVLADRGYCKLECLEACE